MARYTHPDVIQSPDVLRTACTRIVLCSAQPTTYVEGNATYALANGTVDSSDFTWGAGDVSGRKLTMGAQTGSLTATASDDADHIAFLDVSGERLLHVTPLATPQTVTSGNTASVAALDVLEVRAPAAP